MPIIRSTKTGRKLVFSSGSPEGSANSTFLSRSKITGRMLFFKGVGVEYPLVIFSRLVNLNSKAISMYKGKVIYDILVNDNNVRGAWEKKQISPMDSAKFPVPDISDSDVPQVPDYIDEWFWGGYWHGMIGDPTKYWGNYKGTGQGFLYGRHSVNGYELWGPNYPSGDLQIREWSPSYYSEKMLIIGPQYPIVINGVYSADGNIWLTSPPGGIPPSASLEFTDNSALHSKREIYIGNPIVIKGRIAIRDTDKVGIYLGEKGIDSTTSTGKGAVMIYGSGNIYVEFGCGGWKGATLGPNQVGKFIFRSSGGSIEVEMVTKVGWDEQAKDRAQIIAVGSGTTLVNLEKEINGLVFATALNHEGSIYINDIVYSALFVTDTSVYINTPAMLAPKLTAEGQLQKYKGFIKQGYPEYEEWVE